MSPTLQSYYERELSWLHETVRDFSRRYPAEAGRLTADPGLSPDPHLERFIEGFALLAGRLHNKLHDEFPELIQGLLGILYPHFVTPIPSMAMAQFQAEPEHFAGPAGLSVPRGAGLQTRLLGKTPVRCRYRTGYPVRLWPIRVEHAELHSLPYFLGDVQPPPRSVAVLRLELMCTGPWSFSQLAIDRLRFFLNGEKHVIADLYEVLHNHTQQVVLRPAEGETQWPALVLPAHQAVHQVGFELDESLVPWPAESFVGYQLLVELMSFPEKFFFLDLAGWDKVRAEEMGRRMEVLFFLDRSQDSLEQAVQAKTFLLGCTPVINLFENSAEPVAVTQTRTEYHVVPVRTLPLGLEVISVDSVAGVDPDRGPVVEYQPFYGYALGQTHEKPPSFWYARRRPALDEQDRGTEVYLTLVDPNFSPRRPASEVLDIRTTCSNRDFPIRFQRPEEELLPLPGEPEFPGRIQCLHVPTAPLRPPLGRGGYWRLLVQSFLNHVPLTDALEGKEALREILRLCDFASTEDSPRAAVNRQMVEGIVSWKCRPARARMIGPHGLAHCRGVECTIELDEQNYGAAGTFLFASVLERFLGLYTAVNGFSRLIARVPKGEHPFKIWPPRSMDRPLS